MELDEIASVTKVNPTYLAFIEEERFDDLPANVYVRGFVTSYARAIGLDPQRVAKSYMARLEESRSAPRRSAALTPYAIGRSSRQPGVNRTAE